MLKEKKPVFFINDEKIASQLNTILSENLKIETELDEYGFNKVISVSQKDYQKALKEGFIISNLYNWNFCWINIHDEPKPIGYISVMYCILPKNREGNQLWEILDIPDYCPVDIKEYIQKLKVFLGVDSIKINYNKTYNALEFLIKDSIENHEQLKQKCETFNKITKNSPFIKFIFLEKDGTLIKTKKDSNLKSYFNESMFMDGLLRPEGSNIAPKTENDQDFTTDYKYGYRKYGTINIEVNSIYTDNLTEKIQGTFLIYEEKNYNHSLDREKEKQARCNALMPFTMHDNGTFESKISVQDEKTIEVSTNVNIIRNIVGYNFNGKSVRDGLFPGLAHKNCKGKYELKEYYKTISNGTRLLHYSESSDFFEVYDLPNGWVIGDNISELEYPKVFDDLDYDIQDKDLEEIKNILETRTNKNEKNLVKRKK